MAKGPYKRIPLIDVPINRAPASWQDQDFAAEYPKCNIFSVNTIAFYAGFKSTKGFLRAIHDPRSPWHSHLIENPEGAPVIATHTNSAAFGGQVWRAYVSDTHRKQGQEHKKNLKQFNVASKPTTCE